MKKKLTNELKWAVVYSLYPFTVVAWVAATAIGHLYFKSAEWAGAKKLSLRWKFLGYELTWRDESAIRGEQPEQTNDRQVGGGSEKT